MDGSPPALPVLPFRADRYTLDEGRGVLSAVTVADAVALGPALAAIDPWAHYRSTGDDITRLLTPAVDGSVRLALRLDGVGPVLAVIVVRPAWLVGPYLQFLAVMPQAQGQGYGQFLVRWFDTEARRAGARNAWVCVSGFNLRAQRLYAGCGFETAATIDGLLLPGTDELLMRKRYQPQR